MSNDTVFFDVPRGREHTILTCPIPLPTAHMSLNYTITWERIITNSIPIPLTDDPESYGYRLLQNNRSLSLPVSSSTDQKVYRCKLALTRCNITAIDRCVVAPIIGPNIRFKILGKVLISVELTLWKKIKGSHNNNYDTCICIKVGSQVCPGSTV